jgi:hypothetical protein
MDNIVSNYTNVIGAANHNSDPLANVYSDAIDNGLQVSAYPNGSIDRYKFPNDPKVSVSRGKWVSYCAQRLNVTSPCNVNISSSFDAVSRKVAVTVTVDFVANATAPAGGDLRLSVVLIENGIILTTSPQHNYMGQGCSSPNPSSAWYTYPCNISNFIHNHVARVNLANDQWGDNTVIPSSVTAGQSFSATYNYTVPGTWNDAKMQVLAFVSNYHPTNPFLRDLLNANETDNLNGTTTGINENDNGLLGSHGVMPNPVSDLASIVFQLNDKSHVRVNVYNALGQFVTTLTDRQLTPGQHAFYWDAINSENGLYFYEIRTDNNVVTGKILVSH